MKVPAATNSGSVSFALPSATSSTLAGPRTLVRSPVHMNVGRAPSSEGISSAGTVPLVWRVLHKAANSLQVFGIPSLNLAKGGFQ